MTIASTSSRNTYVGNGTAATYSYTFRIFDDSDLLVVVRNTSGVETTLDLNDDYSVSGVGNIGGGSITLTAGNLTSGYTLAIRRVRPLTQETDLRNEGAFYPEVHEDAFDHQVMLSQQLSDEILRSIKLPETLLAADFDTTLPTTLTAGHSLVINDDGDGFALGPDSDEIEDAEANATAAAASAASAAGSATAAANSADDAADSADSLSALLFNALDYGCVNDGTTDNYAAFQALSTAVNAAGKGTVIFPAGVYKVDQYRTVGNGKDSPLQFAGCNGLRVLGYGAKIDIKGNFTRDIRTTEALTGLIIDHCKRVEVAGFEIDGNNDQMTLGGGVDEGTGRGHGLDIWSSTDVTIRDIWTHHHQADGIYFGVDNTNFDPRLACRRVSVFNVKSEYNGREACSLIQVRGGVFINCDFSETGQSSYGSHSPEGGIDIEPDRTTLTASPQQMDVNTGDITFINCRVVNNRGAIMTCAYPDRVDNIHFENCYMDVGASGGLGGTDGLIVDAPNLSIKKCYINLRNNLFFVGFSSNTTASMTIEDNVIYAGITDGEAIRASFNVNVLIKNNRFYSNYTAGTSAVFIRITNNLCDFVDNYIFVNKEGYVDGGSGDRHIILQQDARRLANNRYTTDLLAASGSSGTAHFASNYGANTIVDKDFYKGVAVGTADTFRPAFNSAFDTTNPYSANIAASTVALDRSGDGIRNVFHCDDTREQYCAERKRECLGRHCLFEVGVDGRNPERRPCRKYCLL
jgi:hypothetical protein